MPIKPSVAGEIAPDLYKEELDNGLTLIAKDVEGSRAATVQIWVKAGSIYEEQEQAGITHVIEHMIFKGTPDRGPGEIAGMVEGLGGKINAYTGYEYTVYHATMPNRHREKGLEVLSDAVLNAVFDPQELEREKRVVLEELAMRKDQPATSFFEKVMASSYHKHPYRRPVIGSSESISAIDREDIINYRENFYKPGRMNVVVVGDFEFPRLLSRVRELMGDMTPDEAVTTEIPREPERESPDFFTLRKKVNQSRMALTFPIPSFNHPEAPVMDIIAALLGDGESSRLYNSLRNRLGLVHQVNASSFTPQYQGLLKIYATLDPENLAPALEAGLEEIFKLKYNKVPEDELARVKLNLEKDFVFGMEKVNGQARMLGNLQMLSGDPRPETYLENLREVDSEDIIKAARKYLSPDKITAGSLIPDSASISLDKEEAVEIMRKTDQEVRSASGTPASLVTDAFLDNVHRFQLDNGITLLVREDPSISTVGLRLIMPGGLRGETEATNGAFKFISRLLPEGTEGLSGRELDLKLAELAGNISGFSGRNTFGLKAGFLSRFFEPGLELVSDIVIRPSFSSKKAEKVRGELLARLDQQEDSLPSVTRREFNEILFQGHPYSLNTEGSETAIRNLDVGELEKIYRQYSRPDKLVIAVAGDVKAPEVKQAVDKYFGGWSPPSSDPYPLDTSFLEPSIPEEPEIESLSREKEQVHIIIGFMGAGLKEEDRHTLQMLETVLTGQSGRLFTRLRDEMSLAYSVSAFNFSGLNTGSFGVYIATSSGKKDKAIQSLWEELYRLREENISKEELKRARELLIGHYELGLQTHGSQAMEMGLNQIYGLGQDYGHRFIRKLKSLSAEEIRKTARQYIRPEHYVMITVGKEED
ncbi:MAG: M16 family metallopeptidase [Desulfurivibrionaceae bacterium]